MSWSNRFLNYVIMLLESSLSDALKLKMVWHATNKERRNRRKYN